MQGKKSLGNKFSAPLIICTGALITGVISFLVTIKVYDRDYAKQLEKNQNKVVSDINIPIEDNTIIAKLNEEENEKKEYEKINNEQEGIISENGVRTEQENLENDEINVVEINEEDYGDFVMLLTGENNSNEEKNTTNDLEKENKPEENNADVVPTVANVTKETLEFIMPVNGEIGMNFAKENLVYSNTLEEWIIHNGIDIIGEEAMPVKAIESGIVESIKMDPRYGNTIIIKHNGEYKSIYSNVSTTDLVFVGKNVEKGEIISGIGSGFGFESAEGAHLHFEILKNGESINPIDVIKNN